MVKISGDMTRGEDTLEAPRLDQNIRRISEREIAMALVLEYAETHCISFSLMGFYDDDADFLQGLAVRLRVPNNKAFWAKLTRVVRKLVNYGVFHARMRGTAKEYIDEPAKQMTYWMRAGKDALLRREYKPGVTMGPEGEAAFLLRHAYPKDERPNAAKGG